MWKNRILYAMIAVLSATILLLLSHQQHSTPAQNMADVVLNPTTPTAVATQPVKQMMPLGGQDNFVLASEKSVNAVVHIKTKVRNLAQGNSTYHHFFNPFQTPQNGGRERYSGAGSGVIISQDGYIVTNKHVIDQADVIEVVLNNKHSYEASLIGSDPSTDLAVLKIEGDTLPFLPFGNSDAVRVGQWVLAVGNPFNLTSTVTAGIVSAKARNVHILDNGRGRAIESFIQTDAAINPGNSGGALVNTDGELIGINAAIASNTGSYTGYAFAIPSNLAQKVVGDLIQYGSAQRAYLGVSIAEITDEVAKKLNIDKIEGVYVAKVVSNGAAHMAGIPAGSIILAIEGQTVNTTSQLIGKVAQYHPGEIIDVLVKDKTGQQHYDVRLQNLHGQTAIQANKRQDNYIKRIGATFKKPSAEVLQMLGLDNGMQIAGLQNGLLSKKGVRKGLIIIKLNQQSINSLQTLRKIIDKAEGGLLIEGVYPNGMHVFYGIGLQ